MRGNDRFCIYRGLKNSSINEFYVNENLNRPFLYEEYKEILKTYDLNIKDFIIHQNMLENMLFSGNTSLKLMSILERNSGSIEFKNQYESLQQEISNQEASLRKVSEDLKQLRHEKIKAKGLNEFQKQIDTCIDEQIMIKSVLVGLSLLYGKSSCEEIDQE